MSIDIKPYADLHGADLGDANLRHANLRDANLRDANLRHANLRDANLRHANLYGANLRYANLHGADLRGANLRYANLRYANLYGANLYGANLRHANLYGANLRYANLRHANLRHANLHGAYLRGANLRDADLCGAKGLEQTVIVPETGAFDGYKKCRDGVIVKVRIPARAKRSNSTGRKCRAEFVEVIAIYGADFGVSTYDSQCKYYVGETVHCDTWEPNRWVECGGGIHFFITRKEAEEY